MKSASGPKPTFRQSASATPSKRNDAKNKKAEQYHDEQEKIFEKSFKQDCQNRFERCIVKLVAKDTVLKAITAFKRGEK